ncbi:MAG: hypothetical protein BMS9Abin07_2048 [Acidimicrobiia bacterium]|nr:MAG: hypothetical protein BMS9Abin07_2048 [Acidimicrobiia bacterium]
MISQRSASARALVIISTIVAVLVLLLATAVYAVGSSPVETVDYKVRSGDSLWSIADTVAGQGEDLRAVVATIRHLNDLPTAVIQPGEVLELPVDA